MTVSEAIKAEAKECAKSAEDMRNTPQDREIFYVCSIILNGIAEKITEPPAQNPEVEA